jgi:hypothetical protein
MSFPRHEQIYRPMKPSSTTGVAATARVPSSDESATSYSLASCTPALLASASPVDCHSEAGSWATSTTT